MGFSDSVATYSFVGPQGRSVREPLAGYGIKPEMPYLENASTSAAEASAASDASLVARAARRDANAIRTIMQRYNRRLYRMARSILRNDAEAEDAVQSAYLNAFRALDEFRGEASLATWLTRIVINEALALSRNRKPTVE